MCLGLFMSVVGSCTVGIIRVDKSGGKNHKYVSVVDDASTSRWLSISVLHFESRALFPWCTCLQIISFFGL